MGAASGILQYIEYAVTYEYAIGHTVRIYILDLKNVAQGSSNHHSSLLPTPPPPPRHC